MIITNTKKYEIHREKYFKMNDEQKGEHIYELRSKEIILSSNERALLKYVDQTNDIWYNHESLQKDLKMEEKSKLLKEIDDFIFK